MPDPLKTREGLHVDFANNSQFILLPQALPEYSILRRSRDEPGT
jgi:hypothetical protein